MSARTRTWIAAGVITATVVGTLATVAGYWAARAFPAPFIWLAESLPPWAFGLLLAFVGMALIAGAVIWDDSGTLQGHLRHVLIAAWGWLMRWPRAIRAARDFDMARRLHDVREAALAKWGEGR